MHPWIKSDHPGKCTICGMNMVAVFEDQPNVAGGEQPKEGSGDQTTITLAPDSIRVAGVRSAPLRFGPLTRSLDVSGMVDDDETRHRYISAFTSGRVESLAVNYVGAKVVAGQPLATFYSPDLLIAEQEFLSAGHAADKIGTNAGREKLRRFGLTDGQIDDLSKRGTAGRTTEILSPISGTVVERQVYEGQWVNYGDRLFTVADFSTMWFQFDAYERDLAWLKVGQTVEMKTDVQPGRVYTAPITFIAPNFDPMTRSTKVRVEVANTDCSLPHRIYARGKVSVGTSEPRLLVPRAAVLNTGERVIAYVEHGGGRYEARALKLGLAGDFDYEVLGGLHEGERVVTAGNLLLDSQSELGRESASTSYQGRDGSPSRSLIVRSNWTSKVQATLPQTKWDRLGEPSLPFVTMLPRGTYIL